MKNIYQNAEMEVVEFEMEDIISTSGNFSDVVVGTDPETGYGKLN